MPTENNYKAWKEFAPLALVEDSEQGKMKESSTLNPKP
jgi:hypothetical protein